VRYKVGKDEITTENAAKPMSQASAPLVNWLKAQKRFGRALDYGCGKLRYTGILAENSKWLTVVDSRFQLEREQIIAGKSTTIRRYVRQTWRRTNVLEISEFSRRRSSYNFILCANVLSAIPLRSVRSQVLKSIRARLASNGKGFICRPISKYVLWGVEKTPWS
jgi:2-polyprenyl-3-methyl-5-hydroxy-6-metoxy-1,4-benzoquinol methylase